VGKKVGKSGGKVGKNKKVVFIREKQHEQDI
jgi:hypothetical protein